MSDEQYTRQLVDLINQTYGKHWFVEKTDTGVWISINGCRIVQNNWDGAYMFLSGIEYCLKYGKDFI